MNAPVQFFDFNHWWVLCALFLLPLLGLFRGRRGAAASIVFSSLYILRQLGDRVKTRAGGYTFPALLILTLALGVFALARPMWVKSYKMVKESGIEMILTIDVSRSMTIQDMYLAKTKVDRLTAAKSVIRNFVRRRPMDRIGLVAFSGQPFLVSPITLDHDWVQESINRVQIGMVADGTAIGSAIAASARRLDKRESKSKVVVLVTDGASNAGELAPVKAAELAKLLGVRIYTIAVGTPGRHVMHSSNGPQTVTQEFGEDTLKEIAVKSGGQFFMANDTENLEKIFEHIDRLEVTERQARVRREPSDLFPWAIAAMIAMAVARLALSETVLRKYP